MKDPDKDDFSETKHWPNFKIKWDINPKNYHHCLDYESHYIKQFPDGALLGEAKLTEVIEKLSYMSNAPIGKTDNDYTTILEYWANNMPMTPPLFDVDKDDKICIGGGNHRFYVCRGKKVKTIKFLANPDCKNKLESILSSLSWICHSSRKD